MAANEAAGGNQVDAGLQTTMMGVDTASSEHSYDIQGFSGFNQSFDVANVVKPAMLQNGHIVGILVHFNLKKAEILADRKSETNEYKDLLENKLKPLLQCLLEPADISKIPARELYIYFRRQVYDFKHRLTSASCTQDTILQKKLNISSLFRDSLPSRKKPSASSRGVVNKARETVRLKRSPKQKTDATPAGKVAASSESPDDNEHDDSTGDEDSKLYDVEKIVGVRKNGEAVEYYVKWKNFGPEENTWVPPENLLCKQLLVAFTKSKKGQQLLADCGIENPTNLPKSKRVQQLLANRELAKRARPSTTNRSTPRAATSNNITSSMIVKKRVFGSCTFACSECPRKFGRRSDLTVHAAVHEPSDKKVFECTECSASYSLAHGLELHAKVHCKTSADSTDAGPTNADTTIRPMSTDAGSQTEKVNADVDVSESQGTSTSNAVPQMQPERCRTESAHSHRPDEQHVAVVDPKAVETEPEWNPILKYVHKTIEACSGLLNRREKSSSRNAAKPLLELESDLRLPIEIVTGDIEKRLNQETKKMQSQLDSMPLSKEPPQNDDAEPMMIFVGPLESPVSGIDMEDSAAPVCHGLTTIEELEEHFALMLKTCHIFRNFSAAALPIESIEFLKLIARNVRHSLSSSQ